MCGIAFCPCIVLPARLVHIRNNPRVEIDRQYTVPGTLCQKCRNGKIKHGFIIDGQCVREVKDLYICIQCKTVYPQYNLIKYIGNRLPYDNYGSQVHYNHYIYNTYHTAPIHQTGHLVFY
jgi:hypothetical protein